MEQHPTTPAVQVPPGWPTIPETPLSGAVQLYGEQSPAVVYVPGPGGQMVGVLKEHLPTAAPVVYQPRDLSPQPLFDPKAQRLAAGGVLAGGVGWGGGQVLLGAGQVISAIAGAGSLLAFLALALVAARVAPAALGSRQAGTAHHTTVTNHNRLFGRSTTHVQH